MSTYMRKIAYSPVSSELVERLSSMIKDKVDCLSKFLCLQVAKGSLRKEQAEYTLRSLSTWLSEEGYNHEERMKILSMLFKEEVELLADCFCAEVVFETAGIRKQLRPGPNGINIDTIRYYAQAGADVMNYEVTNAQFQAFVEATGYVTDAERKGKGEVWNPKEQVRNKLKSFRGKLCQIKIDTGLTLMNLGRKL